jgi:hypothetical protein
LQNGSLDERRRAAVANQVPERDRPQHTESAAPGSATPDPIGPGAQETTRMPRWVKVFGIVAAVVVVLVVVMLLSGHGPSRHG